MLLNIMIFLFYLVLICLEMRFISTFLNSFIFNLQGEVKYEAGG